MNEIVCITDSYNNTTYHGGIIIGERYEIIEYLKDIHPNGRFRIKGKFKEQRVVSNLYPKELFITLEDYRENKLNELIS